MKRINFQCFKAEMEIGRFETIDVRKEFGNVLFANATTLEQDELARRIFHSKSDGIEIAEQEIEAIRKVFQAAGIRYSVVKAIEENARDFETVK
ncbi:hypothetical protein [Tannerella forsythia]|uniref:Uncharacterized protein n=2 Tax=Tannerella forsythia TaxID=28112 RepID=A0A2A6EB97_TANFO|nr:hypothetical protein [Tannerella forsythia]PDP44712.1 hypothetical protein CLI86_02215 [Tannerella forsythia]